MIHVKLSLDEIDGLGTQTIQGAFTIYVVAPKASRQFRFCVEGEEQSKVTIRKGENIFLEMQGKLTPEQGNMYSRDQYVVLVLFITLYKMYRGEFPATPNVRSADINVELKPRQLGHLLQACLS
jgi:hypothetical protein